MVNRGAASTGLRVGLVAVFYLMLIATAGVGFWWARPLVERHDLSRLVYIVFGPALALFTHMGYFLCGLQSLILVPWLLLHALRPQARMRAVLGFVACWLAIGWYMHDLF